MAPYKLLNYLPTYYRANGQTD